MKTKTNVRAGQTTSTSKEHVGMFRLPTRHYA